MSKTQFKNAKEIWDAMVRLVKNHAGRTCWTDWMSVGEVAKEAGVSKPTARKYLEMAVVEGAMIAGWRFDRYVYKINPEVVSGN